MDNPGHYDEYPELTRLEIERAKVSTPSAPAVDGGAHTYVDDVERQWVEFWAPICAPNGVLDVEQVKRELSDYSMLLDYVPRVYDHATGGAVSKTNTTPTAVCSVIDDHIQDLVEDAIRDDRLSLAAPSDPARAKMVADVEAEQTYIASCRETCSEYDLARWDRIQAVIDHFKAIDEARAALSASTEAAAQLPMHPKTADLVQRFSRALAEKLSAAEQKYGWSDDWARDGWLDVCREELVRHVRKGDPRDVAAYCAFLWHHGQSTIPAANLPDLKLPDELLDERIKEAEKATGIYWFVPDDSERYLWRTINTDQQRKFARALL